MAPVGLNRSTQARCKEERRVETKGMHQRSMTKENTSALTKHNLKLLENCHEHDRKTQDLDVHNTLRAEQVHSFNEQQGLSLVEWDKAPEDYLKRPDVSPLAQSPASASIRRRQPETRQSSDGKRKPSSQDNQSQLDADLKLYFPLARSSNDHPALRFLSPGAPHDPPVFTRQALEDLKTPYADGSSAEKRRLVGIRNSEPLTGHRE